MPPDLFFFVDLTKDNIYTKRSLNLIITEALKKYMH
jgi:hypothetical protein